jgi:hypothetical protein
VGEVRSQLYVALDQKYITQEEFEKLHQQSVEIAVELSRFSSYLKKLRATFSGVLAILSFFHSVIVL